MTGKKLLLTRFILCVFLTLCIAVDASGAAEEQKSHDKELYKQIELFSDAVTLIQSDYVEEVEPKKLVYGALEGMLSSLDGYSQFMDPDSFREMQIDTKGEFGGLGIEIAVKDGVLTVIAPLDGTPAAKAGLKSGDRIVKIDGEATREINLMDAVKKLRGKPGTKIDIVIFREEEEKLLDFTIVRSIIKIKSTKAAELLEEDIGYIKLVEFQENTSRELEEKLAKLKKLEMKGLILDLRNNPGGLLDVSQSVSEKFLPEGETIVSLKSRIPDQNKVFRSRGKQKFLDFPLVILVNGGSASASEIVAGAIRDNQRGIIVGTKTFGKGSVQTVIPLKDGSAVRITTADYFTPAGHSIKEKGILPDVEIKLEERQASTSEKKEDIFEKIGKKDLTEKKNGVIYDNQLQTAVDVLRGILVYKRSE